MKSEIITTTQLQDTAVALIEYGLPEVAPGVLAICAAFGVRIDYPPRYRVEIVPQIEARS